MTSGAEATVTSSSGRSIGISRGRLGSLVSILGYDKLGQLTTEQLTAVSEWVLAAWQRLANKELKPEEARRYVAGISVLSHPGGNRIEWTLEGFEAISLEFGWAPPPGMGKHRSDGIGEWDGAVHDMRSYMLTSGNPGVRTRKDGKKYLLVPFHENATATGVTRMGETTNASDDKRDNTKEIPSEHAVVFMKSLAKLREGKALTGRVTDPLPRNSRQVKKRRDDVPALERRGGHVVPETLTNVNTRRLKVKNAASKYQNIIRNYDDSVESGALQRTRRAIARATLDKYTPENADKRESDFKAYELSKVRKGQGRKAGHRFTMIRTITEADGTTRSWWTAGYPPANLMPRIRKVAADAITSVLLGRRPSGRGDL